MPDPIIDVLFASRSPFGRRLQESRCWGSTRETRCPFTCMHPSPLRVDVGLTGGTSEQGRVVGRFSPLLLCRDAACCTTFDSTTLSFVVCQQNKGHDVFSRSTLLSLILSTRSVNGLGTALTRYGCRQEPRRRRTTLRRSSWSWGWRRPCENPQPTGQRLRENDCGVRFVHPFTALAARIVLFFVSLRYWIAVLQESTAQGRGTKNYVDRRKAGMMRMFNEVQIKR